MNEDQRTALLKQILVGAGLINSSASPEETQAALQLARQQDPAGTNQALAAGGYPTFPWVTVLGIGAAAVGAFLVWRHYTKTRRLGVIDRPELEDDDTRPRIKNMSRALSHFKGRSGCRMGRARLGDADKYEFEPEIRLEGHRGSRRRKGVRR